MTALDHVLLIGMCLVSFAIALGLTLPALYGLVVWLQVRALLARPDGLERLRRQMGMLPPFVPHSDGERLGFGFALATNSLWPATVLHATFDLVAGELGFRTPYGEGSYGGLNSVL